MDTTCNFQQCWECVFSNNVASVCKEPCGKGAQWHLLCRNQFNALKRERALKGKASDSDEKMMTVERSYHKGELLIQRSVEPVLLLVSFISIHRTSTFNLQSATKLLRHRTQIG